MRPVVMRPPAKSISRVMASAVTDLPEPDSPTTATVSPAAIERSSPYTTVDGPASVAKATLRPCTSRSFSRACKGSAERCDPSAGHRLEPGAVGRLEPVEVRAVDVEHAKYGAIAQQGDDDLGIRGGIAGDVAGEGVHIGHHNRLSPCRG